MTATAGSGQVALSWVAPTNTGGQSLTAYTVYRGTTSGGETKVTTGGCSGLSGSTLTCTDTGLTNGTTYFYTVTASNATGEGSHSSEVSATPTAGSTCSAGQLLGDPGFESGGSGSPWVASSGVFNNSSSEPPHGGSWDAWLDGYGSAHTDTLSQAVTIPAGCNSSTLSFWLHVDTAQTGGSAVDTLKVQLLNASGTVLATLHTFSNLDANSGYAQFTYSVGAYAGQAVTVKFTGVQAGSTQTSFVVDDTALNASGSGGGGNTVTVTSPGAQTSTVGSAISPLRMQASDSASGQTFTWSASGLPAGLSISSAGQISGTPTAAGSSSVTVTATDTTGAAGSVTFSWTVNPAAGNTVTVTSPGAQTSTAGTAISPVQVQASDSATGQTLTFTASGLPAGLSISSGGQITGTPTTAGSSSVTVTATDTTGAKGSATFSWTVNPAAGGCTAAQLLKNPGFESGPSQTAWTWSSTLATASEFFNSSSSEPPHSGTYDAWLNGWGRTDTDTLAQTVTIPSTCQNATLSWWMHIDTAETTTTTKYDTLKLQVLSSSGTVLSTPGTWSNLDHNTGYKQWSVNLGAYIGQTITIKWTGQEDSSYQTSFVLDDTALNIS